MMQRVRLTISGDVQGVGYRAWVRGVARGLGLVGRVKNRGDGTVEVVAEGVRKKLEVLIELCEQGPEVAWVRRVDVAWEKAMDEFIGFEVVY